MLGEPVPASMEEGTPPTKSQRSCFLRFMVPLSLATLVGIIAAVTLLHRGPWLIHNPNAQDIAILKSQAAALDNRISHLEEDEKAPQAPSINPDQIKDFETRIAALHQQIEAIQNQPKIEVSPQLLERSQAFEKDLNRLAETQQVLKSTLLFWRLRTKILSDKPYAAELAAFKTSLKEPENLSILEKYADQGLQVLKETSKDPLLPPSENESASWWTRLKTMVSSFIKVEKVDAPVSVPPSWVQDRQSVEDALAQLDQTLTQKLTTTPLFSSPLPGDAL